MSVSVTINGINYRQRSLTKLMAVLHNAKIINLWGSTGKCQSTLKNETFHWNGNENQLGYNQLYMACYFASRKSKSYVEEMPNLAEPVSVTVTKNVTDIEFSTVMDSLGETYSVLQGLDAEYQQRRQALARSLLPQAEQLITVIKKLAA